MTEAKLHLSNVMRHLNRKRLTTHSTTNAMYLVLKYYLGHVSKWQLYYIH